MNGVIFHTYVERAGDLSAAIARALDAVDNEGPTGGAQRRHALAGNLVGPNSLSSHC